MPRIHYPEVITESAEELVALERDLRGQRTQSRVGMLRLLKTRQACSLVAVAPLVGYGERTVNRWWKTYQTGGIAGLLKHTPHRGPTSRLTEEAWEDLEAAMTRGEIATLRDAQRYLTDQHDITYHSLHGVWWQLRKRKARPKTGRRRHRKADPEAQEDYKRRLWSDAA
jgi:transposase